MIYGVGTDITEIKRVLSACEKEHFRNRIFTEQELLEAQKDRMMLASDYAAKEAVAKALRTGFRSFSPGEIECLRDELGAPFIVLHGEAKRLADSLRISRIHVSLSDTDETALAFAVAEID